MNAYEIVLALWVVASFPLALLVGEILHQANTNTESENEQ